MWKVKALEEILIEIILNVGDIKGNKELKWKLLDNIQELLEMFK